MVTTPAAFPLRLRNPRLRALLREVAASSRVSQNELIEQAIENEVVARGALLAEDLASAAERVSALTAEQYDRVLTRSLERFAAGEAQPEPVQARALHATVAAPDPVAVGEPAGAGDPLGVMAAFRAARR